MSVRISEDRCSAVGDGVWVGLVGVLVGTGRVGLWAVSTSEDETAGVEGIEVTVSVGI